MADLGYLRNGEIELVICRQSAISYPLHNHVSVVTLGFILEGEIQLTMGKAEHLYVANESFIISPYVPHRIAAQSPYTLLSLCVSRDLVNRDLPSSAAEFLHSAIGLPELESSMLAALRTLPFMALPEEKETAVSGLKRRLEAHPEQRLTIDDMAGAAFLSKYHLIRAFRREAGLTPHQFQIQNRVRKAQRLLRESVSGTEAALAAGFCDQSHFIRHFQRLVGLTPTEYKRACAHPCPLINTAPE